MGGKGQLVIIINLLGRLPGKAQKRDTACGGVWSLVSNFDPKDERFVGFYVSLEWNCKINFKIKI